MWGYPVLLLLLLHSRLCLLTQLCHTRGTGLALGDTEERLAWQGVAALGGIQDAFAWQAWHLRHRAQKFRLGEGSLEVQVKLPTIWTDEKQRW